MMLRALLFSLLMVGVFATADAGATDKNAHKKVTNSKQAAKIVQKKFGGKVLKVNKQKNNTGYKVKIVKSNGQVVSKKVNAKTGKIEKN